MSTAKLPTGTTEDWTSIRQEWIEAVDSILSRIEVWSASRDWKIRREPERIHETDPGEYWTWRLTLEAPEGKILVRPFARMICGDATGVIDLVSLDSDAEMSLVRHLDGTWYFQPFGDTEPSTPWSEDAFFETARRLFPAARPDGT